MNNVDYGQSKLDLEAYCLCESLLYGCQYLVTYHHNVGCLCH